ncbi:hypothetical protein [Isoptericola sp. NPDC057191]|uniref:hypothetical protein n=1 Tax=Isoptericola sp. NPDC057191 TaxID=3346041 RepID=UPI00362A71C7
MGTATLRPRQRLRLIVAAALAVVTLVPISASAVDDTSTWASRKHPLIATYGRTTIDKGYGYGWFSAHRTNDGLKAYPRGYVRASRNHGRHTYFSALIQYNTGRCSTGTSLGVTFAGVGGSFGNSYSCTKKFFSKEHLNSGTVNVRRWVKKKRTHDVDVDSSAARAQVKVCLQIKVHPDKCTGYTPTGADKW